MDRGAKLRWSVLGTALAATFAAIFYPVQNEVVSWQPSRSISVPVKTTVANVITTTEHANLPWVAADTDPFAPRGWVAPFPEQSAPPAAAVVARAAEAPLEQTPPPLPYKFVGQMRDGSDTVVYLSLNEQMVLARSGETLEGGYKVAAITASQIEFESVELGVRQTLPIPDQE